MGWSVRSCGLLITNFGWDWYFLLKGASFTFAGCWVSDDNYIYTVIYRMGFSPWLVSYMITRKWGTYLWFDLTCGFSPTVCFVNAIKSELQQRSLIFICYLSLVFLYPYSYGFRSIFFSSFVSTHSVDAWLSCKLYMRWKYCCCLLLKFENFPPIFW